MADHRLFCQDRRGIELFYEAVIEGADGYDDEINSGVTRVDEGIMTNPFNGIYQLSAQHDMAWGVGVKDRKVNFGGGGGRIGDRYGVFEGLFFRKFLTHFAGYPTAVIQPGLEVPVTDSELHCILCIV
jgi:hypothetical protein